MKNMVNEQPEHGIFFIDAFGDQAFKRWSDIDVDGIDTIVGYLVMVSTIKTTENARFFM